MNDTSLIAQLKSICDDFDERLDKAVAKNNPRKVKNGWQIAVTWKFDDGTQSGLKKRMTGYGASEEAAYQSLQENILKMQTEISHITDISNGSNTVGEALKDFIDSEKNGSYISKKTGRPKSSEAAEHDEEVAKALIYPYKRFNMLPLSKVTLFELLRWQEWVNKRSYRRGGKDYPYSADRKNKALFLLKEILTPYYTTLQAPNPTNNISRWSDYAKGKTDKDILNETELKKLLSYCYEDLSDHNRAQAAVQILTYVRVGELLGLKVSDFDEDKGTLSINRKVNRKGIVSEEGQGKSKNAIRSIILSRQAILLLHTLCHGKAKNEFVFLTPNGQHPRPNNYLKWTHRTLKRLDINKSICARNFRTTGITFAICTGGDVLGVSKNAGHAKLSTTFNHYTAVYASNQRKAADSMSRALDELMAIDSTLTDASKAVIDTVANDDLNKEI
ncbi:MAG: tyrosine-type recombinase/integrase [Lachnospiraceae bacterium]|nr:tyrosine-type recombinase/integrase [Lachnospiraceae bacterium]